MERYSELLYIYYAKVSNTITESFQVLKISFTPHFVVPQCIKTKFMVGFLFGLNFSGTLNKKNKCVLQHMCNFHAILPLFGCLMSPWYSVNVCELVLHNKGLPSKPPPPPF